MTTERMGRVHVFVMEPTGSAGSYIFPWDWSRWRLETRLVPTTDSPKARAMGTASFRLLRKIRYEPEQRRNFHLEYADGVIAGAWVCIATGDLADILVGADLDPDAVLWWGWISNIDKTPVLIDSFSDAIGTVTALEVGHMLDSVQLSGWRREAGDGSYPTPMGVPPTANIATKGGIVIGNAVTTDNLDGQGNAGYAFARLAENCSPDEGNIFTRWRLLRHLLLACRPAALPILTVTCADGSEDDSLDFDPAWDPNVPRISGYLNDTTGPEIFDLRELTAKGALDLLIPETHDLDYRIDIGRTTWGIRIATVSTDPSYELPAAEATDITLDRTCESFSPSDSAADIPDEVVFEGGPHIFGVSAGYLDENWIQRYSSDQQTAYEAADPDARRTAPEHEDTFTLFGVNPTENGDLRRSLEPGETTAGALPMCPEVGWSGSATNPAARSVRIGQRWTSLTQQWSASSTSFPPYLPSATLLRTVPWPLGLASDGIDSRTDENKAHPVYMKPKVFNYDDDLDAADKWFDLTAKKNPLTSAGQLIDENPQVDVDDGSPGLRIAFAVPHRLALGTFDSAADDDGVPPEIDWRNFIVTFAIPSDQRLRIVKRRQVPQPTQADPDAMADLPDNKVRRSMVVRDDRYQLWAVLLGTVLGVKEDGGEATPDRLIASNEAGLQGYITRNDYPAAEKYARRLAAWAFRPRNPVSITLIRPDAPPAWARVGVVLGQISDPDINGDLVVFTSNTIIREIRRTWGDNPRIEISTEMLAQPKPASPSPTAGGSVSVANGGTLAQGVARLRSEVSKLQEGTQRQMIHVGATAGGSPTQSGMFQIIGGNSLAYLPGSVGITKVNTLISVIPAGYSNGSPSTLIDGVGWARSMDDDSFCLVVNDSLGLLSHDILMGTPVFAVQRATIDDDAGGTYRVYRVTGTI